MEKQKNILVLVLFGLGVALAGTIGATTLQTSLIAQQPSLPSSAPAQNLPSDPRSAPEQSTQAADQTTQPNSPENIQQPPRDDGQSQICKELREAFAEREKELSVTVQDLRKEYGATLDPAIENKKLVVENVINESRGLLANCEGATEETLKESGDKLDSATKAFQDAVDAFLKLKDNATMQSELRAVQEQCGVNRKHLDEKGNVIKKLFENINLKNALKLLEASYKDQCVTNLAAMKKALKESDSAIFWAKHEQFWKDNEKFSVAIQELAERLAEIEAKQAKLVAAREEVAEITTVTCKDITVAYNDVAQRQRTQALNRLYKDLNCRSGLINTMSAALKLKDPNFKQFESAADQYKIFTELFWKEAEKIEVTARFSNLQEDGKAITAALQEVQEQLSADQKATLTGYANEYSDVLKKAEKLGEKLDYATMASLEAKAEKVVENFYKALDQILMEIEKRAILTEATDAITTVQSFVKESKKQLDEQKITALEHQKCVMAAKDVEAIAEKLSNTNDLPTMRKLQEQLKGRAARAKTACVIAV